MSSVSPEQLDGVMTFGVDAPDTLPALVTMVGGASQVLGELVEIASTPHVDSRLRGRALDDADIEGAPVLKVTPGDTVVASVGGAPVWVERAGRRHTAVSLGPGELPEGVSLRSMLAPGRWLGVVPLVSFIRALVSEVDLAPPPPKACFVMDDPNLHTARYGYLGYRELIRHGDRLGHHTSIAMVPLDAYFARSGVVGLFRDNRSRLSLSIHGNDHRKHELDSFIDADDRVGALSQSLERMSRFERRTGLHVERIMVPPHEAASLETVVDLAALGFEAATMTRTEPWAGPWPGVSALAGWLPAHVGEGVPVISRFPLGTPPDEIALHAFLDQPLVVYGHHWDLRDGLDILETYVTDFARLEGLEWVSLEAISRSNYAARAEHATLTVRPYGSTIDVDVPGDVDQIRLELPATFDWCAPSELAVSIDGTVSSPFLHDGDSVPLEVKASTRVRIDLLHPSQPLVAGAKRQQAWPLARRLLTEARDRATPAVDTVLRR
jgi:hypothetical protein